MEDVLQRLLLCKGCRVPGAGAKPTGIALVDADGTLWTDDIADSSALWMREHGYTDFSDKDWEKYHRVHVYDVPWATAFFLSFYAGRKHQNIVEGFEAYCQGAIFGGRSFVAYPRNWVHPLLSLLRKLKKDHGYEVWVISASPLTVIEVVLRIEAPGLVDRVFGCEFDMVGDVIKGSKIPGTDYVHPAGAGKEQKILQVLDPKVHCVKLTAGNAAQDAPMMRLATHPHSDSTYHGCTGTGIALAVHPDEQLRDIADQEDWDILDYSGHTPSGQFPVQAGHQHQHSPELH